MCGERVGPKARGRLPVGSFAGLRWKGRVVRKTRSMGLLQSGQIYPAHMFKNMKGFSL